MNVLDEEAHRLGIYHELTSSDTIWARAHQLAEECAKSAPESLQLTKRMLNETVGEHLSTLLSAGAAACPDHHGNSIGHRTL